MAIWPSRCRCSTSSCGVPSRHSSHEVDFSMASARSEQMGASFEHLTIGLRTIDWKHAENKHFGIAEEVTVKGLDANLPGLAFLLSGRCLVTAGSGQSKQRPSRRIRSRRSAKITLPPSVKVRGTWFPWITSLRDRQKYTIRIWLYWRLPGALRFIRNSRTAHARPGSRASSPLCWQPRSGCQGRRRRTSCRVRQPP